MKQVYKQLQANMRLLKLMHSLQRSALPIYLLRAFIDAGTPYIMIIGSAKVLDALLHTQYEAALWIAIGMVSANFLMQAISAIIERHSEIISMALNRYCNAETCLKAISLDYATFADKKNLEEFQAADYNVATNGGFGSYLLHYYILGKGCISLAIALIMLAQLCMQPPKIHASYAFFLQPSNSLMCMGVLLVVLIITYASISSYVNKKNLKLYYERIPYDQQSAYFMDKLSNDASYAKEIRMYELPSLLYQEWKALIMKVYDIYQKGWKFDRLQLMVSSLLNDIVLLFAYLFVLCKVVVKAISTGALLQYVGAIQQMNRAVRDIVEAILKIQLFVSYLSFYTAFMEKQNQMDTGSLPVEKRQDNEFEIVFHDVSFHYPQSDDYALRHVSLKLDMKKRFALVGRNGAGKTTFIKLLCRMYDVSEGFITLNGVDIRKYDYEEYLKLFAAVFQDFSLFSFSIRENVACQLHSEEAKVWQMLDYAGIKERVASMPQGLDTHLFHELGDGVEVSGGEAQKIAIARALYRDAPFVILDEPTAALDPLSEYEIYARFDAMVKDKTSIYISHRMSSCRFCDDILVFDDAHLVQRGSHEELMQEDGLYAKLWNAQARYYVEEGMESLVH